LLILELAIVELAILKKFIMGGLGGQCTSGDADFISCRLYFGMDQALQHYKTNTMALLL
jgi:hypothetical protein